MTGKSKIEWTERTWNPIAGCSIISHGCKNCYAMRQAHRHGHNPKLAHKYGGLTKVVNGHPVWNGTMRLDEKALMAPLLRKQPTMYFVNSMSDLFHESVPDDWIHRIMAVAAACPQHTFQILTKRSKRARDYMNTVPFNRPCDINEYVADFAGEDACDKWSPPLPNVWLGVSVEDQHWADQRIPDLVDTTVALRFLSCEPLLGALDLSRPLKLMAHFTTPMDYPSGKTGETTFKWSKSYNVNDPKKTPLPSLIDWVIVGGESGPGARPMHPGWARSLRDQCLAAGVPFFFKQWGEFAPYDLTGIYNLPAGQNITRIAMNGAMREAHDWGGGNLSVKLGKKAAGRFLDDRFWSEMPIVGAA